MPTAEMPMAHRNVSRHTIDPKQYTCVLLDSLKLVLGVFEQGWGAMATLAMLRPIGLRLTWNAVVYKNQIFT